MGFDLEASERRIKPQRRGKPLRRRADEDLPLLAHATAGPELLLDTCVYLDVLRGAAPACVDRLLELRHSHHCAVVVAELTHALGRLQPEHEATAHALATLRGVVGDIPSHRLSCPSTSIFAEAGMLAGLVCRLSRRAPSVALLNDATIFLHGRATGRSVLTGNLADFDLFDQLLPGSELIFYRCV